MNVSDSIAAQLTQAESLLGKKDFTRATEIFRKALGSNDLSVSLRIRAADGLGRALFAANDLAGAEDALSDLLDLLKETFGPDHKTVALSYQNLARVMADKGDTAAINLGEKALAILKKVADQANKETKEAARGQLAAAHFTLSYGYYNAKNWNRAEEHVRAALAIWEEQKGMESTDVATCFNNLGRIYEERGQHTKGVELHKKALALRRKILGTHEDTAFSLGNLGTAQAVADQLEGAIASLTEAVAIYTELGLGEGTLVASYKKNLELCTASFPLGKRKARLRNKLSSG